MTPEELLMPRYKVIADYPGNTLRTGTIIKRGCPTYEVHINHCCDEYPHIFRKLEWWEDRAERDMPEYLKLQGRVFKATDYSTYKGGTFYTKGKNEWMPKESYPLQGSTPATQTEYEAYLKTK